MQDISLPCTAHNCGNTGDLVYADPGKLGVDGAFPNISLEHRSCLLSTVPTGIWSSPVSGPFLLFSLRAPGQLEQKELRLSIDIGMLAPKLC